MICCHSSHVWPQDQNKKASAAAGGSGGADDDEEALFGLQAGSCSFALNTFTGHLFIVGTEEGTMYKCSKAYSSRCLETYRGHHMGVYSVAWNKFHPRIFLSGSADWTVKMWDHNNTRPILSLDLNGTGRAEA